MQMHAAIINGKAACSKVLFIEQSLQDSELPAPFKIYAKKSAQVRPFELHKGNPVPF